MDIQHALHRIVKSAIGILPKNVRRTLFGYYWTVNSPDRKFLVSTLLPAYARLGGRILWIGCERYTKNYPALLEKYGAECWTLEIRPECARWGNKEWHVIGSLLEVDKLFGEESFDAILCNGVFGFGVNSTEDQKRALDAMRQILKPGGYLLLGISTYRTEDPILLAQGFVRGAPEDLETHYEFPTAKHVYDLLRSLHM